LLQLEELHVGQLLSYNGENGADAPYSLWLLVKEELTPQQLLNPDWVAPERAFQLYNLYERYDPLEQRLIHYIFAQDQCRSFAVVNNAR
jgi:hypothetical protein